MLINIGNRLFLRDELNGVTVYDLCNDKYVFFENLYVGEFKNLNDEEKLQVLKNNLNKISTNINLTRPFRINWLVEERCNLNCIYCYADNKLYMRETKEEILQVIDAIKRLNVINVGITGGECTINPYLDTIIDELGKNSIIIIDTNGTLSNLKKIIPNLKKCNSLVRISIDSIDENINKLVRPCKNIDINTFASINDNIDCLIQNKINMLVHTVITKYNIDELDNIAEYLISKGIKRWHLYDVSYCEKNKHIYNNIHMDKELLKEKFNYLEKKYKGMLNISIEFFDGIINQCTVPMIDSKGNFFLDTIFDGIKYIGRDSKNPSLKEYMSELNCEGHAKEYLTLTKRGVL